MSGIDHNPRQDRLGRLLASANAPAQPGELAGERAAVAAFTAARHSRPSQVRRPSMIQMTVAKLLTAKVAAIAVGLACAGAGGVALAATTGVLPTPVGSHRPGTHPSRSTHPSPAPSGSTQPWPSRTGGAVDFAKLCHELHGRSDHGKALQEKHFGDLVRKAGSTDYTRVEKFCAPYQPSSSTRKASPSTNHQNHPSGPPNGNPAGTAAPNAKPQG